MLNIFKNILLPMLANLKKQLGFRQSTFTLSIPPTSGVNVYSEPATQVPIFDSIWNVRPFRSCLQSSAPTLVDRPGIDNPGPDSEVRYLSSNPSIFTVDPETGVGISTGNGIVRVIAVTRRQKVQSPALFAGIGEEFLDYQFSHCVPGSVCRNSFDEAIRLTSASDASNRNLWATKNHGTATYIRNPDYWLKDVDGGLMSATAVWSDHSGDLRRPTLITPDCAIQAAHWLSYIPSGGEVRFVGETGTVHTAIVESYVTLNTSDWVIYKFQSPLPADVVPVKLLPENWGTYAYTLYNIQYTSLFPENTNLAQIPNFNNFAFAIVRQNQFGDVGTCFWWNLIGPSAFLSPSPDNPIKDFDLEIIDGDSGLPNYAIIDDSIVFIGHTVGAGAAAFIWNNLLEIRQVINTLGGDHTEIQYADFNQFLAYLGIPGPE